MSELFARHPVCVLASAGLVLALAALVWLVRRYERRLVELRTQMDADMQQHTEETRLSREQYKLAIESSDHGVWDWDIATDKVHFSPHWKSMLGYADEEVANTFSSWEALVHPEDRKRALAAIQAHLADPHTVYELEHRLRHKDGSYRWILARGRAYCDANGRPCRMAGSHLDITERKQADVQLRESEARLASAIDLTKLGFYTEGPNERFHFPDDRVQALFGFEPGDRDRIRTYWAEHIHPDDRERMLDVSRRVRAEGVDYIAEEYRFLHPQRGTIWVNHLVHVQERDAGGTPSRTIGVLQDITERKRVETQLRESETRLSSAIEIAKLGFYERGVGTQITFMDDRVRAIIGIPADQESRAFEYWLEHLHPEDRDRILDLAKRAIDEREMDLATFEFRFLHPQQGVVWHNVVTRIIERDAAGRSTRLIGVFQDVTDRKVAEAESQRLHHELMHASRVASLGELSSAIAHQLNQPLTAILSNAEAGLQMMRDGPADPDEAVALLSDIAADAYRAGDTIHRLRTLLAKGAQTHRPFDLNNLVQETLRLLQSDSLLRGVQIGLDLVQALPPVQGDPVQIQQVILNLVTNAMDAVSDAREGNRTVVVRVERSTPREIRVSVKDRGSGFTPEAMASLFEHFFTSKPKGLGMGLPIARRIVTAHGGRIWAENNADCGATLHFTLPVEEQGGGERPF